MLIRGAEVAGRRVDVRITNGCLEEIGPALTPSRDEELLEAAGGALLPGLQDHHIHLHSLAAAMDSLGCGPPDVEDPEALERVLSGASDARGWLRGSGYFESVAGPLDRDVLDAMRADVPIRIQHRSGSMWFLNSRALERLGLAAACPPSEVGGSGDPDAAEIEAEVPMIERDASGRATGRLFRADAWLRARLPPTEAPDLAPVGRRLAAYGVTAVTDATPTNAAAEAALFRRAQASGALPQRVHMMGALDRLGAPTAEDPARARDLLIDAHKIMLDEPALPDLRELAERIGAAHEAGRAVAIHTVTRAEILFALAALEQAGTRAGDRLEHASVAPPEVVEQVDRLALTIVTQPGFVAERGDAYRRDVARHDLPHLYRVKTWLDRGIRLGAGTDAPFGHPDPWRAMRAAVRRQTRSGRSLGPSERVSPETALALFLPGFERSAQPGPPRTPELRAGAPADLCLLTRPWSEARLELSSENVAATWRAGRLIYRKPDSAH